MTNTTNLRPAPRTESLDEWVARIAGSIHLLYGIRYERAWQIVADAKLGRTDRGEAKAAAHRIAARIAGVADLNA